MLRNKDHQKNQEVIFQESSLTILSIEYFKTHKYVDLTNQSACI